MFSTSFQKDTTFYVNGELQDQTSWIVSLSLFMLLHMLPVWIYLFGVLTTFLRLKHNYYLVTDSAVYISKGTFQLRYDVKPFAEMSRVVLHQGVFDRMFGVGDVYITTNQFDNKGRPMPMVIADISNFMEVYQTVQKLQKDIYSDTMYPNDLRPRTNHGYKTKYTGI